MQPTDPFLSVRLIGPEVEAGRIPADDLALVLKKVQLSMKRLGESLSGRSVSGGPGRIPAWISDACTVQVSALRQGSVEIGLELMQTSHQQILLGMNQPLGEVAALTLVDGLERLAADDPSLVTGFDYGVLVALRDTSQILTRGVERIEFRLRDRPSRVAVLNSLVRDRVVENIMAPMRSSYTIRGRLREIDLERNRCDIYPTSGSRVECTFEEALEPSLRDALDAVVAATGEVTVHSADGRIQSMTIRDLEVERQTEDSVGESERPLAPVSGPRSILAVLRNSGVVGMWADRTEAADSTAFAQELRSLTERRSGA